MSHKQWSILAVLVALFCMTCAEPRDEIFCDTNEDCVTGYACNPEGACVKVDPLLITTESLGPAVYEEEYSETILATGGIQPYRWEAEFTESDEAVSWLGIGEETGRIQSNGPVPLGAPEPVDVEVTVWDSSNRGNGQKYTRNYELEIKECIDDKYDYQVVGDACFSGYYECQEGELSDEWTQGEASVDVNQCGPGSGSECGQCDGISANTCSAGKCVCGSTGSDKCSDGQTCCVNACCAQNQLCCVEQCVARDRDHCVDCDTPCTVASGGLLCDEENDGQGDWDCTCTIDVHCRGYEFSDAECDNGTCKCGDIFVTQDECSGTLEDMCCNDACVDLYNDPDNCGMCGVRCARDGGGCSEDKECIDGACTCGFNCDCPENSGAPDCVSGACVCFQYDGNPCPVGQYCCLNKGCCTENCGTATLDDCSIGCFNDNPNKVWCQSGCCDSCDPDTNCD